MEKSVIFLDAEFAREDHRLYSLGAVCTDGSLFRGTLDSRFRQFLNKGHYLCGHNIVHHDWALLKPFLSETYQPIIDTLYLSALLFPKKPYHRLVKDEKIFSEELCNPVDDALKCQTLFAEEVRAFKALPDEMQQIYYGLLKQAEEFRGFFAYLDFYKNPNELSGLIAKTFEGKICQHSDLSHLARQYPMELAYALSLIRTDDKTSIHPAWLLKNFPHLESVITQLRSTPCKQGCTYCREYLDVRRGLKNFFGFDQFRTYDGEPLQEKAARAAVLGDSLLAIFPTGGGKSLTFQLPALMAGEANRGLTIVLSPLQSLMKDQVDQLHHKGFAEVVTINGLLNPLEKKESYDQICNGNASLLYIAPESLRSRTLKKVLLTRRIERIVIDEAHCFSSWGHDFRVDYLYIADFIADLQRQKGGNCRIPVSCFTATAKPKVIQDIRDYFREKLGIELKLFVSSADRKNLRYTVWHVETEEDKYPKMRELIEQHPNTPCIVYVSRVDNTSQLAQRLTRDGLEALPYNGKMSSEEKSCNQDRFLRGDTQIIVATNAFGMGVDKKDVGLVIHYDISSSLENYVQEAGRAGRDPSLSAECHILFNEHDLDKHFQLLNQNKLSIAEIQQIWRAIKEKTRSRKVLTCSALELARSAGWDTETHELETRVKTAISALELAGYIRREENAPRVYATGIQAANLQEATVVIDKIPAFNEKEKERARRIMARLISSRHTKHAQDDTPESRVDYLADLLGLEKRDVIHCVTVMREFGLLNDNLDLSAFISKKNNPKRTKSTLESFLKLEQFLLKNLLPLDEERVLNLKELNTLAVKSGLQFSSVKKLRTLLYYLRTKNFLSKVSNRGDNFVLLTPSKLIDTLTSHFEKRAQLCLFILDDLFSRLNIQTDNDDSDDATVRFSVVSLLQHYRQSSLLALHQTGIEDIEDALLYLTKIQALQIEGGFLVIYNAMTLRRLVPDNHRQYKLADYRQFDEYYKQKIQQIHIVGRYANLLIEDYEKALQYVRDYFQMNYKQFVQKYFKGEKAALSRNITQTRFNKLFGSLSEKQLAIINDRNSQHIVVAAGPGSGKTKVLVHKLASLLLMEDIKHDQLLMLTFSRAAATHFKQRLIELIGNAAYYVDVKTFHSYCFDLLGRVGSLDEADDIVAKAAELIGTGEVEQDKIAKLVLVIDEAQDMSAQEFELVQALMKRNENMRVIAVGDDDQNIYEFRGSDSCYFRSLVSKYDATRYEMNENYRSCPQIVAFSNDYAQRIKNRMKSIPATAVSQQAGSVELIEHTSEQFERAIVNELIQSNLKGKTAVLTSTNEEAMLVFNLLVKNQLPAKLVQSRSDIKLTALLEVRSFLVFLLKNLKGDAIIDDELWNTARTNFNQRFANSSLAPNMNRLLDLYQSISGKKRYLTDLEEFIEESQLSDTVDYKGRIFVSTIHKAKGMEFDNVYMLLNRPKATSDAEKRTLYVGMTRAKTHLMIHYSGSLFSQSNKALAQCRFDPQRYLPADEILLPLVLNDVYLDFVIGKKKAFCTLRSGQPLIVRGVSLFTNDEKNPMEVARLSQSCQETLKKLERKGYRPIDAEISFIVGWKKQGQTDTHAVVLPTIELSKKQDNKISLN